MRLWIAGQGKLEKIAVFLGCIFFFFHFFKKKKTMDSTLGANQSEHFNLFPISEITEIPKSQK